MTDQHSLDTAEKIGELRAMLQSLTNLYEAQGQRYEDMIKAQAERDQKISDTISSLSTLINNHRNEIKDLKEKNNASNTFKRTLFITIVSVLLAFGLNQVDKTMESRREVHALPPKNQKE